MILSSCSACLGSIMRLQLIVRYGRSPDITYSMTPVTLWTYVALPTDLETIFHANENPQTTASPKSLPASSVAACHSYLNSFITRPSNFPPSPLERVTVDISVIRLPHYPCTRQNLVSSNDPTPSIQHHPRVFCILVIRLPLLRGNICKPGSYTCSDARKLKRKSYVHINEIMTYSMGHTRYQSAFFPSHSSCEWWWSWSEYGHEQCLT